MHFQILKQVLGVPVDLYTIALIAKIRRATDI